MDPIATSLSTDNILMVVDSKKRYSGTTSNFIYRIDKGIDRIRKITVVQLSLPFSYWVINPANNILILNNGSNTATVPNGTYNLTNFQLILKNALNAAGINSGFSVVYSLATGRITIANSLTSFTINSVASQPLSTFSTLLGFSVDATGTSVTGDSSMNIAGPRYLYVISQKLCKYFVSQRPRYADSTFNNAIGIVVPNVAFGGFITEFTPLEVSINDNKGGASYSVVDDIDFTLYNEYGQIVDLNGLDWLLVLKMEQS